MSRESARRRSGLPFASRIGLTTTSHHRGWPVIRVAKYPAQRPVPPATASFTAALAASLSSPSQKSIQELSGDKSASQIEDLDAVPAANDQPPLKLLTGS